MKQRHKYIDPVVIYLLIYVFGIFLFSTGSLLARYLYTYMNYLLPSVFPTFSPISEKEGYAAYLKLMDVLGIFTALFLINYLALRFDNKKLELVISRTDGQYTLGEGLQIYTSEFLLSDIISAAVLPALLALPSYFIPEIAKTEIPVVNLLIALLDNLLWLGNASETHFGIIAAIPTISLLSALSRALLVPHMLKKWRAAWLSGSIT